MTADDAGPIVDVVILTWNDAVEAHRAVRSALSSASVRVRVTVVDNGSERPFVPVDDPRVSLIASPTNLGVGGGRNLGAAVGHAGLICFLDSDAELDPHCLERLAACLDRDRDTALASPVFSGQVPEVSAGAAPSISRKVVRGFGLTDRYAPTRGPADTEDWPIGFAIGACQMVRRDAFHRIGGFDSSARFGPEDVDLCLRLAAEGLQLRQVGSAACAHVARRSSRKVFSAKGLRHLVALIAHYRRHRVPMRS